MLEQAWADSITVDEPHYIWSGACLVSDGLDRDPSQPIGHRVLSGLAVRLAATRTGSCASLEAFYRVNPDQLRRLTLAARVPNLIAALLLAVVVFFWGRALYGAAAGAIAMSLLVFEPTVLAHGHLATGDLPLSLGVAGTLGAHWAWSRSRHGAWLLVGGLALGWALLSKVVALELLPLVAVAEFFTATGSIAQRARAAIAVTAGLAALGWVLVCLAYLPVTLKLPTSGGHPALLAWVVPPGWFFSLSHQLEAAGAGRNNFLNGQVSRNGFAAYFLEAFALKTTLGMLGLVALSIVAHLRARARSEAIYMWLPVALLFFIPSLGKLDLGVRYLLPAYPLLALAAGSLAAHWPRAMAGLPWLAGRRAALGLTSALVFAAALSSLAHRPLHIGYFNELAGSHPERYLSNSNLDWGQDAWRLRGWWDGAGRPPLGVVWSPSLPPQDFGIEAQELTLEQPPPAVWLAVSLNSLDEQAGHADAAYAALKERPALGTRIGSSIQLLDNSTGRAK